jgi:uncharacterized membrane protein YbhN (UPF0104 family)
MAAALLAAVAITVAIKNSDRNQDLASAVSRLPWTSIGVIAVLPALVAVHFISAALALRAVSDERLALRSTTFAQFAAAAANRVVPNGIGGAGLNLRFLLRSGLTPGAAASALAALALVGAGTDTAYVCLVTAGGPVVGLTGAAHELRTLAASGLRAGKEHYWLILVSAVLLIAVALLRRRGAIGAAVSRDARDAFGHSRGLVAAPARCTTAAVASMATTVAMSVGFVLSVDAWGHAATPLPAGALVAVYLVAAAAGTTTPLPAFFGVTEVTMVGALTLGGYTSVSAVVAVVVFRAVAYWLPLPVGVWAARQLRRGDLL